MGKIKLYQFPKRESVPNFSPFCLKLETYFKLAQIPYEPIYAVDVTQAPKFQFPYIEMDGHQIGDSSLIIEALCKQNPEWDLDRDLTPEQRALSRCMHKMCEESLAVCMLKLRWTDDAVWPHFRKWLFAGVPEEIALSRGSYIQEKIMTALQGHGYGIHSLAEITGIAQKDIDACHIFLGKNKFIFGEKPHMIDCVFYGLFANFIMIDFPFPLKEYVLKYENLVLHTKNMNSLFHK